jgi:hypothetical protein
VSGVAGERREFLERSLVDLDEEHDAGDLSDDDHARLRAEYEERLAILDGRRKRPAGGAPAAPRPAWHRVATWGGVAAFAFVAGILLAQYAGRRDADQSITGIDVGAGETPVTTPEVDAALARCFELDGSEAFECYIDFTRANPDDPDGFLYFGLYSINQGLQTDTPELLSGGETFLRRALELDPELHEARVNLAVFLERTGRDDEAAAELAQLDGVDLPDDLEQLAEFVRSNLGDPAESTTTAPAGATTTSTTTAG